MTSEFSFIDWQSFVYWLIVIDFDDNLNDILSQM